MSDVTKTIEYKGFEIEIIQDRYPENPFEAWDGNPPLAVYSDRDITEYATKYGHANEVPTLTRAQIAANLKEILEICEAKTIWALTEDRRDWRRDCLDELINERIAEAVDGAYNSDRLELLYSLYNMAGIPALCKSIHGYCQGDYAEVLAVATPEFQKACGNEAGYWDNPETLKGSIDLFKFWAYGDVYGYSVEFPDGETDSCFGFYGDDYEAEYGPVSEAKSAIDHYIEKTRKARIEKVKTWIKNHVPLQYRVFEA